MRCSTTACAVAFPDEPRIQSSRAMNDRALLQSQVPGVPVRRGKVRDVYEFDDRLLIVATDRISAFDWILPTGIPDKGKILTQISAMWFARLGVRHHLISDDPASLPLPSGTDLAPLVDRSMVVRKTRVVPIECVARGFLAGSGWKEYEQSGAVCGIRLPPGLRNCERLPEPLFTPATKADVGHDENISFDQMCALVGDELSRQLRDLTLSTYAAAQQFAESKGLILADTKFEFGQTEEGGLLLIDEALTPDSSRYWPAESYRPGSNPPSFDKQFVRDWLDRSGWDKSSPPPPLPDEIVVQTRARYLEAYRLLVGRDFQGD